MGIVGENMLLKCKRRDEAGGGRSKKEKFKNLSERGKEILQSSSLANPDLGSGLRASAHFIVASP
jgi:hypothetical protein